MTPASALDLALRAEGNTVSEMADPKKESGSTGQSPTSIDLVSLVENIIVNFVPEKAAVMKISTSPHFRIRSLNS